MRNEYKKLTFQDEFGRKYYGRRTKESVKKWEDRLNKKRMRQYGKKIIEESLTN